MSEPSTPDDALVASGDADASGTVYLDTVVGDEAVGWDGARHKDRIRGYLAMGLLGLLAVTILLTLCLTRWVDWAVLKGFLELVLSPLVALIGAATGFYFGAQSRIDGGPGSSD